MSGCDHRHLLVVGAQRCGTTYLSRALDAHPDVTMARPSPPEPKVFCDATLSARGAESYHRTWFAHARDETLLGDKSTSYLEDPQAPGRAAEMLGEPEVVVLLRDPVRRAVSHWRFSTANGFETRDLEDALLADLDDDQPWDPQRSSVSPFAYLRRGRYAEQLEPWSATFPSTTHVLFTEELLADPAVLTGLVADLGLDPGSYAGPRRRGGQRDAGRRTRARCRRDEHARGVLRGEQRTTGRPAREAAAVVTRDETNNEREVPAVAQAQELEDGPAAELPDIPFNVASVEGRELDYVQEVVRGGHLSSGGAFARRTAELLAADSGAAEVLMTTSCTAALELSAMLMDLQEGDTVIVPSFTFTSTGLAFARQGAGLLFCDIEPDTLGLDPAHLATLLDEHVRAVVIVHYAGVACDVEGIRDVLADWPEVQLVEDNAHGLFGTWRGEPLGSLGRFATLSFHETKNFVCGEGGALLLNDPEDVDRARVLYDKGTNRHAFMLGQVDKYTWKDTGSSFGLSDVLAAYLLGQLEQRDAVQGKRRRVGERYAAALAPYADELGFEVMRVPADRGSAHHMFYVLLSHRDRRNDVLELMRKAGVQATFHYQPLHTSDAGRSFAVRQTECPVSQDVSGRLLRLPFHNNLSDPDLDRVVAAFLEASTATLPER